jgi:hypothetical protein
MVGKKDSGQREEMDVGKREEHKLKTRKEGR